MRMPRMITQELGWAIALLLVALLVDFAWVRPGEADLRRLETQKKIAERTVTLALQEQSEWESIQRYFDGGQEGDASWRTRYLTQDPLRLLEDLREESGLRRVDLRLQSRETLSTFTKTTYFMSVHGSFDRQVRFLKSLEEAQPLVTVESFEMVAPEDDSRVTYRLTVSVLTLGQGELP